MKILCLLLLILLLPLGLIAQEQKPALECCPEPLPILAKGETDVYTIVEEMPVLPGNDKSVVKYIQENLKYPEEYKDTCPQGTVYAEFVVDTAGKVTHVKVIRGVPGAPGLNAEAIRVISSMPSWIPGKQNGKPVKVKFTVPVKFKIQR
jgi:periplasmic protein TonB